MMCSCELEEYRRKGMIQFERGVPDLQGLLEATLSHQDTAEAGQRRDVVRIFPEDRSINPAGPIQAGC